MKYTYSGPVTGAALPGGVELMLTPGRVVELDPESELTKTLVGMKRLAPVPAPAPAPAPAPVVVPEPAPRRAKR